MTIKELKEELANYPEYLDIVISNENVKHFMIPIEIISRTGNTLILHTERRT